MKEQSVLLVVDAQVGVMSGAWNSTEVLGHVAEVIDSAQPPMARWSVATT